MTLGRGFVMLVVLGPIAPAYYVGGSALAVTVAAVSIPTMLMLAKRWL